MPTNAEAKLTDFVLPIVEVEQQGHGLGYRTLLGSGFLIGDSTKLLTARHVLESGTPEHAVALIIRDGAWITVQLDNIRHHATEDVSLCDVNIADHPNDCFNPTSAPAYQSADCHIWGYPTDVLYDAEERSPSGAMLQRPELIFTKSYIRRRISKEVRPFRGRAFFEIGDSAGSGCSGGPMIIPRPGVNWNVVGIYIGESISTTGTEDPSRFRGYSLRVEAIADWLRSEGVTVV